MVLGHLTDRGVLAATSAYHRRVWGYRIQPSRDLHDLIHFGTRDLKFNGERDHVHLLVHYPPKVAISRLVGSLKGVSARRLRHEFPSHIRTYLWGEHFWSPSYFAASCGGAPLAVIREYIENQKLRPIPQTRAPARVRAALRSASSRA
ncbi:IS200/IS605 family transposase [Streptomyces kaempferi]|uniref:IS200/IS605 family transposase n=1 Tax=Streptomyces kaempferi TaxID=333725 RepID=A0ABW3XVY9_9ACTN